MFRSFPLLLLRIFSMAHQLRQAPRTVDAKPAAVITEEPLSSSVVASLPGDVKIGVLLPLHHRGHGCKLVWEQYGIHRAEMALMIIDEINNNSKVLPYLKLGIEIRDSCWTERVAVEQTISFIQHELDSKQDRTKSCTCLDGSDACSLANAGAAAVTAVGRPRSGRLVAVIGPGNSANSKAVQNLLQIFRIPQIGYSATSTDLSNKEEFRYFMRVVPSDAFQALALVDIIRYFNWTYPSVLFSEGNYGEKGFEELEKRTKGFAHICTGFTRKIPGSGTQETYDRILEELIKSKPKVVICFCEGGHAFEMLRAIDRYVESNPGNESDVSFQWIGSESWGDRPDVVKGVEQRARGAITLRIYSPKLPKFDNYYLNLKPSENLRNPWFREFWEQKFNCSLAAGDNLIGAAGSFDRSCEGNEDLSVGYQQDRKLAQMINSIYTVAFALDKLYRDKCRRITNVSKCAAFHKVDGNELFFKYMMKVNFTKFEGMDVSFDANGDPPARYEILNFQEQSPGRFAYVKVGEWAAARISQNQNFLERISLNNVVEYFNGNYSDMGGPPLAVCSLPCKPGQYKKYNRQDKRCCWICVACKDNEYITTSIEGEECQACAPGWWPTESKDMCYKLNVEYLRWTSLEAVLATVFACVGIVAMVFTTAVFVRFNNTPVVKSTTRELSYIILAGILICYATTFVIIMVPSEGTCYVLRIAPGLAFSMMYGALLTKTNRIARILAGSKKIRTKRQRFMSLTAQLVITCIIVLIECTIIGARLLHTPPMAIEDYKYNKRVLLVCNTTSLDIMAPLGFDFFLICLCTLYAIKTRNLPENFNEAKFIGFTMYTTCIIWLAFLAIYFGSDSQSVTMCFSFSLSASVALVLLFFPKVYIMLFHPHKNDKSYFKTNDKIRMNRGCPSIGGESMRSVQRTFIAPSRSRPVSMLRSQMALDVYESRQQNKSLSFTDSLHVPAPNKRQLTSVNSLCLVAAKASASANSSPDSQESPTDGTKTTSTRAQFQARYYPGLAEKSGTRPELSIIEEGQSVAEDSAPVSASQDSSSGSKGNASLGGGKIKDSWVQTGFELLEELILSASGLVMTTSIGQISQYEDNRSNRRNAVGPEYIETKHRRSFSEYRKMPKGPKLKLKGQPSGETLEEMVAYRLRQFQGMEAFGEESPCGSPVLYRRRRSGSIVELYDPGGAPNYYDYGEVHPKKKHMVAETLSTAFGQLLGASMGMDDQLESRKSSLGALSPAMPFEHQPFSRGSFLIEGLGATSVDPFVSPAVGNTTADLIGTSVGGSQKTSQSDTPKDSQGPSPVLRRKRSIIARFGYSLRKKLIGHVSPTKSVDKHRHDSETSNHQSSYSNESSVHHFGQFGSALGERLSDSLTFQHGSQHSSGGLSVDTPKSSRRSSDQPPLRKISAVVRPAETVEEEEAEDWLRESPLTIAPRYLSGGRNPLARTESQDSGADSGFISRHLSDKVTSSLEGSEPTDPYHTSNRNSQRSKQGSLRHQHGVPLEAHLVTPGTTVVQRVQQEEVHQPPPRQTSAGVGKNGDLQKLQQLLTSKGLKIELTESTLV